VNKPTIHVKEANALEFASDVLILKYAQAFRGVDELVAQRLKSRSHDSPEITPPPGKHVLLPSNGQLAADNVLFVGTPNLDQFGYPQIREFSTRAMRILAKELPEAGSVSMTMHGVGFGLDEREAFLAQLAGLVEAFEDLHMPAHLNDVTIVERNPGRVERLQGLLLENLPSRDTGRASEAADFSSSPSMREAGIKAKPHVFVAMPFSEDMEDVYIFGIQGPVNAAGYLCERVDQATFTGDILARIKTRIETASLVIADITGSRANVYLEIGYAWGKGRPTLLVAKKGELPEFDVQSQRRIVYKNIADLAKSLARDLPSLLSEP
jgi:hypothetical protein